jgi:hypothetical protein
VNVKNNYGKTPLHVAAERGQGEIIVALFEAGANVNALDNYKCTPLDYAQREEYKLENAPEDDNQDKVKAAAAAIGALRIRGGQTAERIRKSESWTEWGWRKIRHPFGG